MLIRHPHSHCGTKMSTKNQKNCNRNWSPNKQSWLTLACNMLISNSHYRVSTRLGSQFLQHLTTRESRYSIYQPIYYRRRYSRSSSAVMGAIDLVILIRETIRSCLIWDICMCLYKVLLVSPTIFPSFRMKCVFIYCDNMIVFRPFR